MAESRADTGDDYAVNMYLRYDGGMDVHTDGTAELHLRGGLETERYSPSTTPITKYLRLFYWHELLETAQRYGIHLPMNNTHADNIQACSLLLPLGFVSVELKQWVQIRDERMKKMGVNHPIKTQEDER